MPSKKLQLTCKHCGSIYIRYRNKSRPQKFCSRKCYLNSAENKETQRKRMTGLKGDKNYGWLGDKVSYKGLHKWVEVQLGKSKNYVCQHCKGKSKSIKMNWANLDHKYSRDLSQWVPLCKICHSQYDQTNFKVYSHPKSITHRENISKGSRGISRNKGKNNPMYGISLHKKRL